MKKNKYQAIVLKTLCALAIFSGDVYSITVRERFEDFAEDASYIIHRTANEIRESFQPRDPWEALPERLERAAERHGNRIYNRLPDLFIRRVNNAFNYIERQLDRFAR